jgi:hypothetical protein
VPSSLFLPPLSRNDESKMKLAVAALILAPAVAFSPAASFGTRRSALHMSTETASETKVCS